MKLPKTRTALGFGTGICSVGAIIPLLLANFGGEIHTSKQGLEIIGDAEGCRRDPYKCPADVLTVGVGSTAASGEKIDPKHRYSDLEIAERWKNDIVSAEQCCGAVSRSTMFKHLQTGNYKQACNEFPRWVYAGGRKLPGLAARREKEKALCLADLTSR